MRANKRIKGVKIDLSLIVVSTRESDEAIYEWILKKIAEEDHKGIRSFISSNPYF